MSNNLQAILESLRPLISSVRTDITALKRPGKGQFWTDDALTDERMLKHLNGVQELRGVCPIKEGESTTQVAVLDLDSHKGEMPWDKMLERAWVVVDKLNALGFAPHLFRSSGGNGIHIIMLWNDPQDAASVRRALRAAIGELGYVDKAGGKGLVDNFIEVFPKQDSVPVGGKGNQVVLPLGGLSRYIDPVFGLIESNDDAATMIEWQMSAPVATLTDEGTIGQDFELEQLIAQEPLDISEDEAVAYLKAYPAESCDYEAWVRAGAAIHHQFRGSERGLQIFDAWSKQDADRYDKKVVKQKWDSFGKYQGQPMTMASIIKAVGGAVSVEAVTAEGEVITKFESLKREAATIHDDETYRIFAARVASINKNELGDDFRAMIAKAIHDSFGKQVGLTKSDVRKAITHKVATRVAVSGARVNYSRDDNGLITCSASNNNLFCSSQAECGVEIRYDTFIDAVMFRRDEDDGWQRFSDEHYVELMISAENRGFAFSSKERIRDAVYAVARANQFDSAQLWLSQQVWDGVPRVRSFFSKYFGVEDSSYSQAASMYIWAALAGRVMVPGIQADMTPVLVGHQGLRKTSGIKAMAPQREYFTEVSFGEKEDDLARKMRGSLVCEIAELRGLRSREKEHIKAWMTRTEEKWTPKFKEFSTAYARRSMFIGSTNDPEFLDEDASGQRRWLPLSVSFVDVEGIAADCWQLWAEGYELFTLGGICYQDAERLAKEVHDDYVEQDAFEQPIREWLKSVESLDGNEIVLTMNQVLSGALGIDSSKVKPMESRRAGTVLKKLGAKHTKRKVDGIQTRAWVLRKLWQSVKSVDFQ